MRSLSLVGAEFGSLLLGNTVVLVISIRTFNEGGVQGKERPRRPEFAGRNGNGAARARPRWLKRASHLGRDLLLCSGLLRCWFDGSGCLPWLFLLLGLGRCEDGLGFGEEVELAFAWDVDVSTEC